MNNLESFLEKKGVEYAPFDPQRVHRIYAVLKPHLEKLYAQSRESAQADFGGQNLAKNTQNVFANQHIFGSQKKPFIIHILGTNGKGSTGRFITLGLAQKGHKVLHFTSPHLFKFNERFYFANVLEGVKSSVEKGVDSHNKSSLSALNAKDSARIAIKTNNITRIATDSELETAHLWLQRFPIVQEASYFEYATFLALYLAKDCDYFVCEAGLGGEYDSTSVLNADLSIFTPISFDHQDMLGDSIKQIATTKLKAMSKCALLAPQPFKEVTQIAKNLSKEKGANVTLIDDIFTKNCLPTHFDTYAKQLAPFLKQNLFSAYKALESIGVSVDFATLAKFDLPARAQYITPNILVDVGHNVHCAHSILQIVKQKRVILVYNTFFDKDTKAILGILKPIIDRLLILEVQHSRILPKRELIGIIQSLGIKYADFEGMKSIKPNNNYVVFGSFSVVKTFMEIYDVTR